MMARTPDGRIHRILHNATLRYNGTTYCWLVVIYDIELWCRGRPWGTNIYVLAPAERLPAPQPLTCLACLAQEP